MWLSGIYKTLLLNTNRYTKPAIIFYSNSFYYILNPWAYKRFGHFALISKWLGGRLKTLTVETKNIRFKYVGKAYRISKKGKILVLNLHYPTFKYVLWHNIKLYHKKKRKKVFKFKILTSLTWRSNFFFNMFKLRVPDTYTKRGILNNVFPLNVRKQKAATAR